VDVQLIDAATVTDRDIAAWHECAITCAREMHPQEPLQPIAFTADMARRPGTARPRRYLVAWDDDHTSVLGSAETHWHDGAESHRVQTYVEVIPSARRRGVGRALVDAVREVATADGRTSLLGSAPHVGAGIDFARAVGAKFGLDEIRSVYRFDRQPPPRAEAVDGFTLVTWEGECPEEHLESFARLRAVMNTAPQGGDVFYPHDEWDDPRVRRVESTLREQNIRLYVVTALDDTTKELVGYTEVALFTPWPAFGDQWDTGVLPAYRGRGIARWVKSEMILSLRAAHPDLEMVVTWNAAINDSMLAVNKRLGYGDRETWIEAELTIG
jgi:mycothiol synthase